MTKNNFEGFTYVDGGVCAAEGFTANGLNAGINPDKAKNDLGAVVCSTECDAAGVFTTNKVKGAPVIVSKKHLEATGGKARAILVNSKNANTCNADGCEIAEKSCLIMAEKLGISPEEVMVASTGVIGMKFTLDPFVNYMDELLAGLSKDGDKRAANAIMTTDTFPKEVAVEFELDGKKCHMGGMAKGSGMINPNMATTLNFITSDVNIEAPLLKKMLSEIVKVTYNCLSIDGDESTNDTMVVLADGLAGNERITSEDEAYNKVKKALYIILMNLTRMLARDGEGATKLIEVEVTKAAAKETALVVAKSVVSSNLLKCAIFGEDANWGRILCAVGYADADFDINKVDVDIHSEFGRVEVCRNGAGVDFSEKKAAEVLKSDEIYIDICLNEGDESGKAWGCDLTYDYVKINGDYRS
ncbi:MAG: bifunctional glutamate N-acetyltransferase/amino-acid acetyltransferase ArgJ [Lachnospiraceae bacterium]|jgi:glutamate N-acetyltransferase/amino-acid N-acetyltransferase|nr:bifunctional glutamate N-acetyltransferase/amino-acid acetyltransferase ArgJ [Lachnospiraceae bacterium]MEE3461781.1 bifunctional glutamate N-acetyltransferase/amino-acid acetyltransferase ArgJ [Lachnospiraceae bacterium]